jgi:hypothetical protein
LPPLFRSSPLHPRHPAGSAASHPPCHAFLFALRVESLIPATPPNPSRPAFLPRQRRTHDGDGNMRGFAAPPLAVIQRSAFRDEGSPSCPALHRRELLECGGSATAFPKPPAPQRDPARSASANHHASTKPAPEGRQRLARSRKGRERKTPFVALPFARISRASLHQVQAHPSCPAVLRFHLQRSNRRRLVPAHRPYFLLQGGLAFRRWRMRPEIFLQRGQRHSGHFVDR